MPKPAIPESESRYAASPQVTDPNASSLIERMMAGAETPTDVQPATSRWGLPDGPIEPTTKTASTPAANEPPKAVPSAATPDAATSKEGEKGDKKSSLLSEDDIEKLDPKDQQGHAWKVMKEQHKLLRKENSKLIEGHTKLSDEIKALQSSAKSAETPAELQQIQQELAAARKERDEIDQVLKTAMWERHPEFQKRFTKERETAMELAKRSLPGEIFGKAKEILRMAPGEYRDGLLSELADSLPTIQRDRLGRLVDRLDEIGIAQESELAEGAKRYEQWQTSKAAQQKERNQQLSKTFDTVLKQLQDPENGLELFKAADQSQKAQVSEIVQLARNAWTGQWDNPETLARLQLWGAAFPTLLKHTQAFASRVAELQKEIDSLKSSTPGVKGGGETSGRSESEPQYSSFAEMTAKLNPSGRL